MTRKFYLHLVIGWNLREKESERETERERGWNLREKESERETEREKER